MFILEFQIEGEGGMNVEVGKNLQVSKWGGWNKRGGWEKHSNFHSQYGKIHVTQKNA